MWLREEEGCGVALLGVWVGGFWGDVGDADHGGVYGITHRRALCHAQG